MADLGDLRALNEDDFRDEVIIPLFKEMGFNGVKNTHGSMEFGRDVVFYTVDPFGNKTWHCSQLKVEQIHGTKSNEGNYGEISSQIKAAFSTPYRHAVSGDKVNMTTMYVITSQDFTDEAEIALISEFGDKPVYLIDGEDVMDQVTAYEIPITSEEKFDKSIRDAERELSLPHRVKINDEKEVVVKVSEPMGDE